MSDKNTVTHDYHGNEVSVDAADGIVVSIMMDGVHIPLGACAAFELGVVLIERSGLMDGYKNRTPGMEWAIVEVAQRRASDGDEHGGR